jgi:hypothetical protein
MIVGNKKCSLKKNISDYELGDTLPEEGFGESDCEPKTSAKK